MCAHLSSSHLSSCSSSYSLFGSYSCSLSLVFWMSLCLFADVAWYLWINEYIHIISYGNTTIMYADVVCMDCILFILPGPSNDYICGSNSMDVVCSM
jgi:hypothetical protein